MAKKSWEINSEKGLFPIVYVRGYAMTPGEKKETFHDAYYGFSATSVEKRQVSKEDNYWVADIFEGQLIRFMKQKEYGYADAFNNGLNDFGGNPSQSIWICRFYDQDFFQSRIRKMEDHAEDLIKFIFIHIPKQLINHGIAVSELNQRYKVILLAHSMGGLVCRAVIQSYFSDFPKLEKVLKGESPLDLVNFKKPSQIVHRLITMGSPHKGIDFGNIPDIIEDSLVKLFNPYDSNIFKEERMRQYLNLEHKVVRSRDFIYDLHSLGKADFPVKRCLCIIGSDHGSYSIVKNFTGGFSDGLVKQSHAYMVSGPKPTRGEKYSEDNVAWYANVHRAHSGICGIVNSYESFENIHRFLFGNLRVTLGLKDLIFKRPIEKGWKVFHDIEFAISIRGTGVYLHRREQERCENAIRIDQANKPLDLAIYTGFLNSNLRPPGDDYSHFLVKLKIKEYRVKEGWLWDTEYPSREIFSESIEMRVGDPDPVSGKFNADYQWHSDSVNSSSWNPIITDEKSRTFGIDLRSANALTGKLVINAGPWPDKSLTFD